MKKQIIISCIIILLLNIIMPVFSFAALSKEQQILVNDIAIKLINKGDIVYSDNKKQIELGKQLIPINGEDASVIQNGDIHITKTLKNNIALNSTAFCNLVYNRALGSNLNFNIEELKTNNMFEKYNIENAETGDILINDKEIGIYLENGKVARVSKEKVAISNDKTVYTSALRLKSEEANKYDLINKIFTINTYMTSNVVAREGNTSDDTEQSDFYYNGIPEKITVRSAEEKKSIFSYFKLTNILDFLVGIMLMGNKIQIVGWTSLIENTLTNVINDITYSENVVTPAKDINDRVTLEKILYNEVPLFNANMFEVPEEANDGILKVIRTNIANWYYSIRLISIIILLATLIYIGIQMAFSTIAAIRAEYKKMLINWFVSFIIVFFIHYFMIFIVEITEKLVLLCKNINENQVGENGIYTLLFESIWKIGAKESWQATIVYVVFVYYLFKFAFLYLKRFFIVAVLTFISPFIGISYAIEKIKDNKSKSFSHWMSEYIVNVGIQFFHALIYTVYGITIVNLIGNSSQTSAIGSLIILFVLLQFLSKAEIIIKKIFKFGGNGSSLKNIDESTKGLFAGIGAAYLALGFYKNNPATKFATAKIDKALENSYVNKRLKNLGYNSTNTSSLNNTSNSRQINYFGLNSTVKELDGKIEASLKNEYAANKQSILSAINTGKNYATSAVSLAMSLPMIALSPVAGITNFVANKPKTLNTIRNLKKDINLYKYNKSKKFTDLRQVMIPKEISSEIVKNYIANGGVEETTSYAEQENSTKYNKRRIVITALTAGANIEFEELNQENRKKTESHSKEREGFLKAKTVLTEIEEEKEKLKEKNHPIFFGDKENANEVDKQISNKYKEQLRQNLEEVLRKPDEEKIREKVNGHLLKNNFKPMNVSNLKEIAEELGYKTTKKFGENLDDKKLEKMDTDKLTRVLKTRLNKKENVVRAPVLKEFKPIIEKVETLDKINIEAKEKVNSPIYEDYNQIINKILEKKGWEKDEI